MHFSNVALPFMAVVSAVYAQGGSIAVYSDAGCKKQIQTLEFKDSDTYQCLAIHGDSAKSVKFSKAGFTKMGFNVWDSDYCAGDMAGGLPSQLGTCISAPSFGVQSWKSAHIAPRDVT